MRRRDALVLALCGTRAVPAAADAPVRRGRALHFPRDHGAHLGAAIEWWYLTGELRGAGDAHYGFQITFFRSRTGLAVSIVLVHVVNPQSFHWTMPLLLPWGPLLALCAAVLAAGIATAAFSARHAASAAATRSVQEDW